MALMEWQPIDLRTDPDEAEHRGDPGDLVDVGDLLAVLVARPWWHAEAACRGMGTSAWFPGQGGDIEPAIAVCSGCEVAVECALTALAVPAREDIGVWGGLSGRARRQLRRAVA